MSITITASGDAQAKTNQYKFVSSSLYLDGSGDYVTTSSTLFNVGANAFTLDFWVRPDGLQAVNWPSIITNGTSWSTGTFAVRYDNTGYDKKFSVFLNPSDPEIGGDSQHDPDAWYHIAIVRAGTALSIYVNGVLDGSSTVGISEIINLSRDLFRIGWSSWDGAGGYFKGWIDKVRLTSGDLWSSNFTPPSEYIPDANTLLLIDFDNLPNGTTTFRDSSGDIFGDFTEIASVAAAIDAEDNKPVIADAAGLGDATDAYNTTSTTVDGAGASDQIDGLLLAERSTEGAGLGDAVSASAVYGIGASDTAGLLDGITAGVEYQGAAADAAGISDSIDAMNLSRLLGIYALSPRRYYCTLTGAEDGLDDIEIPISVIQARLRQGEPTYLSVIAPGMALATAIAARSSGQLVVEMAIMHLGVEVIREEIIRADLESIRTDEGPRSKSITLTGHKTITYNNQISSLRGVNYRALLETGALSFRCAEPDLYLRPGDTCRYGDDEFTAGMVQYTISPKATSMTVTEAVVV